MIPFSLFSVFSVSAGATLLDVPVFGVPSYGSAKGKVDAVIYSPTNANGIHNTTPHEIPIIATITVAMITSEMIIVESMQIAKRKFPAVKIFFIVNNEP